MIAHKRVLLAMSAVFVAVVEGMLLALSLHEPSLVEAAPAAVVRYVATTGSDSSNDCTSSIAPCHTVQYAVDQSDPSLGNEVRVATGVYTGVQARGGMTQVVYISQTVTVRGGYSGDFATWNPEIYPTTLDAQRQGRVLSIVGGSVGPTLDSLTITGGDATGVTDHCPGGSQGCGGGVFVYQSHPIIVNNVVTGNVAAVSTGNNSASGGGLCLAWANGSVISGNLIISNTASPGNRGKGGGIHLSYPYNVLVVSNQILSNTATTHNSFYGWGGGIAVDGSGAVATVRDNLIAGNRTNGGGGGEGAGIFNWYSGSHFVDNRVVGNWGPQAVYLGYYTQGRFESNQVTDNSTTIGVETYNSGTGHSTLVNNVVARSGDRALSFFAYSGAPLTVTLVHNTLIGAGTGSGVYVETGYVTLFLTNTIIASHTWGITNTFPASSTVTADYTLFWANGQDGITGTHPVYGDPVFVDPGGYHLGLGSAAVDAGVGTAESLDIDGDSRPLGPAPDIGADEVKQWRIFLPLVLLSY